MRAILFLLWCSCLLLGAFGDSVPVFVAATAFGSTAGALLLAGMLRRPQEIRLSSILAMSLCLGYALSTLWYVAFTYFQSGNVELVNVSGLSYTQGDLSFALILIYLAVSVLIAASPLEVPLVSRIDVPTACSGHRARIFIWALTLLVVAASLGWQGLGYMGIRVDPLTRRIAAIDSIAALFAPVLPTVLLVVLVTARRSPWRPLVAFALALSLGITALMGRRVLLCALVLIALYRAMCLRQSQERRVAPYVLGILVALPFVYYAFSLFWSMRLTVQFSGSDMLSLYELLPESVRLSAQDASILGASLADNLRDRPFILWYVAELIAGSKESDPLHGGLVAWALQLAVPSVMAPSKMETLVASSEDLVHDRFGLPPFDGPESIITSGVADFGWPGAIVYPLLMVSAYLVFMHLVSRFAPPFVELVITMNLVFRLLYVEQALPGLVTTALRDLMLVAVIMAVIWRLFRGANESWRSKVSRDGRREPGGVIPVQATARPL